MEISERIRHKLNELPHRPGVYLMKDRFGRVIYVGKARNLRKRVSQYFQSSRRERWDPKFQALTDAIADLDVHPVKSDAEAVLLEGKLIKEYQPRYNVSFRDDKQFLLLKVNLNDPIPRFTLTRVRQDDGARYFGPFANAGALRRTLNLVRKKFHLRGCRPLTPTEQDYKHCLYAHLKVCTAPCIGAVSREQYLKQVEAACEFLEGQYQEMREELEADMKKAAASLQFERAAELRDMIADLEKTTQKTEKFHRVPQKLPVASDPESDLEDLRQVLQLPERPGFLEGFDISNISGTFAVASMVRFKDGRPERANYRRFKMKSVVGQDDFACMAETVRRRYSRVLREQASESHAGSARSEEKERANEEERKKASAKEKGSQGSRLPDLILIDGGKGQLSAACQELDRLGLNHIPIIGLAKEFEEIYRPGESEPLRLDRDSGALKLLQRVRDESHRFANTYNAKLRLKKISESILDEFPGIGERRKAQLLQRFGSIQRLKSASVQEIAEVPGFGKRVASELKAFLDARDSSGES